MHDAWTHEALLLRSGAFVFLACGEPSPSPPATPSKPDICLLRHEDGRINGSAFCDEREIAAGRQLRMQRVDGGLPDASVAGRLPPEEIRRVVRAGFSVPQQCYEAGLARNRTLTGRVSVRFVIGLDGRVRTASDEGSTLPDDDVVRCVVEWFTTLEFPQPKGGIVTVVYPIVFDTKEH